MQLGLHVRTARDAVDVGGADLDDYTVASANASYHVSERLQLFARVENVFDEDYQEVPLYNTAGTAGYAGLRYRF